MAECEWCGEDIPWKSKARGGRPARFCGTNCRVASHRDRQKVTIAPGPIVTVDPEMTNVLETFSDLEERNRVLREENETLRQLLSLAEATAADRK